MSTGVKLSITERRLYLLCDVVESPAEQSVKRIEAAIQGMLLLHGGPKVPFPHQMSFVAELLGKVFWEYFDGRVEAARVSRDDDEFETYVRSISGMPI